mmetsp:Transcript_130702/g.378129  ORF Transcript_130702/g.378129 Transcript_130702/m.378129 type:complete len:137 (+) Transcript_130702:12-422(+)|eukprot:CAMPEP_0176057982 /NCGR_PEP_ID=MMETSP0120_2-20121206/28884_1 /TAXON_ID=160619 /ORGANISM="Kryptoperidinium foliaceum, Strain CCMP 1326" /LENGTH=136 /DNA_ID=CAMNT_0017391501 /DNA_START=12 /DNA_END=422 /DNA_ORIENTATION=+
MACRPCVRFTKQKYMPARLAKMLVAAAMGALQLHGGALGSAMGCDELRFHVDGASLLQVRAPTDPENPKNDGIEVADHAHAEAGSLSFDIGIDGDVESLIEGDEDIEIEDEYSSYGSSEEGDAGLPSEAGDAAATG